MSEPFWMTTNTESAPALSLERLDEAYRKLSESGSGPEIYVFSPTIYHRWMEWINEPYHLTKAFHYGWRYWRNWRPHRLWKRWYVVINQRATIEANGHVTHAPHKFTLTKRGAIRWATKVLGG